MTVRISSANRSAALVRQIEELSGQDLLACYQCGKCSAGCPMTSPMDILPSQVIRMAQLGMTDPLIESRTIWSCVSCMTCNSRCPKGINIAEIIEALRLVRLRDRHDELRVMALSAGDRAELPPIALISAMRKLTS